MENQKSAETLKKRKFLMVLPLLMLPFLSMAFWALGGGKASSNAKIPEVQLGFNTELPKAQFNANEKQDKFSVYEASAKAGKDSNQISDDAYNSLAFSTSQVAAVDPNEQKINERLSQINAELNRPTSYESSYSGSIATKNNHPQNMSADVDRLESLMANLQSGDGDETEMTKLNAVLEKILDIQHPSRAREKLNGGKTNNQKGVFAVQVTDGNYTSIADNAIKATIHQDQDIVSGAVVKLRLLDSIKVNGTLIPKNEFIYGIAAVEDERLKINIATLRFKNSILPVSLSAYDLDGLEGLYIPGAIARDASKKGVDDAIQSLQIMTMDPSVSAQVAGAGIQAAKGLFGRKVKQLRVKVKAGYQLLLKDNDLKNQ